MTRCVDRIANVDNVAMCDRLCSGLSCQFNLFFVSHWRGGSDFETFGPFYFFYNNTYLIYIYFTFCLVVCGRIPNIFTQLLWLFCCRKLKCSTNQRKRSTLMKTMFYQMKKQTFYLLYKEVKWVHTIETYLLKAKLLAIAKIGDHQTARFWALCAPSLVTPLVFCSLRGMYSFH